MRVDLNSDIGESFGVYTIGNDEIVLRSVTSVSVACGYHGGDPTVIRRTIRLAKEAGVAVGAHPSFPDLQGFGRRVMRLPLQEVEDMVLYQIGAVAGIAAAEGVRLQHVKPHGSLGNMVQKEADLAAAVARAVAAFDPSLILIVMPGLVFMRAGEAAGLRVACEVFADRAYEPDGTLVPRSKPGAVIHDPDIVIERVVRMVREGTVTAEDGSTIRLRIHTICTHGDTPGAAELTRRIREGLEAAGVTVEALGKTMAPAMAQV